MVLRYRFSIILFLLFANLSGAQTGTSVKYISPDDQNLTINKIVVPAVIDNVNSIYSKNLTDWVYKKIEADNQWIPISFSRTLQSDYLEPEEAQKILQELNANAIMTSRVLRGPKGLHMRMTLYVGPQGYPLVQESKTVPKSDSLDDIQKTFSELYDVTRNRLPYDGIILSRTGQNVTISMGRNYSLSPGNQVDVIQILQIKRHPKHHFMVSSEKSIIGKVVLTKVENALSFGRISFEKEPNVIRPTNKVISQRMIKYPNAEELIQDPNFGPSPQEWIHQSDPQFGKIILWAGIGNYSQTADLQTEGGISGNSPLSPTIKLDSELWLNQLWFLGFSTMQSAFTLSNPVDGDSPSNLSTTLSSYSIAGGYNWLLGPNFYGPKIQLALGLHQWTSDPAKSSPTVAFSRLKFGGMYLGFNGSLNIADELPWEVGAQFKFFLTTSVSENPSSGSASSPNITDFSIYTRYRKNSRLSYMGQLAFEGYSSDFSGSGSRPDPATETSYKNTLVLFGVEYAF